MSPAPNRPSKCGREPAPPAAMRPRSLKTMAAAAAPFLVLAAVNLAALPARAADATSGAVQSAYWWQGEMAGAAVPAPPDVPSGGLWVSSNPSGTQAISAIRFTLAPGQATAVVTLTVHQAEPASQVALSACPTTSNWSAGQGPGTWADRPVADCQSGQVPGQLNSGATTVTFNLTSLAAGSDVDAVIVPTPATAPTGGTTPVTAPAAVAPTFDITFEPFTAGDVAATAVSQPGLGLPDRSLHRSPAQLPVAVPAPGAPRPVPFGPRARLGARGATDDAVGGAVRDHQLTLGRSHAGDRHTGDPQVLA